MSDPENSPALERFVRSIPLFSLVEEHELLGFISLLKPVSLTAGQVLFREGEPGDAMWVLGAPSEVSISASRDGARPVIVAYVKPGEAVGEMALIDGGTRSGTALVTNAGPAYCIEAADFLKLRQSFTPAAYKVMRRLCMDLCARLRATHARIAPESRSPLETPALPPARPATDEAIDAFPPFRALPQVVKLALAQKLELIELPTVTPIFGEGEQADAAYFLVSGEVTVGRGGRTLATLGPGSMLGLVSALDAGRRGASCVSTGPARLLRLRDADFDSLFGAGHRFAYQMVEWVARQLVLHLRQANAKLPAPGQQQGVLPSALKIPALTEEDFLPEAEVLPLELDLKLGEVSPDAWRMG